MKDNIVKVRGRHGTKSLDITIPAKLSAEHNINPGDLFKVNISKDKDKIKLTYELIYKSSNKTHK